MVLRTSRRSRLHNLSNPLSCLQNSIHHGDRKSAPVNHVVLLEANPLVGFATILGALRKAVV